MDIKRWHSGHVRFGGAPGGKLWLSSSNAARNKLILGDLTGLDERGCRAARGSFVCSGLYATIRAQRCERFAALRFCIPCTRFIAAAGEPECQTSTRRPPENPRTRFSSVAGLIHIFILRGHSDMCEAHA